MALTRYRYIFDVDGTLTPSRGKMNPEFAKWFASFAADRDVYLVTGSDRGKTLEQISESVYNQCVTVYQCNGNDVWSGSDNIKTNKMYLDERLKKDLQKYLDESLFPFALGDHFDYRPGLVNFSIMGRPSTPQERHAYVMWDDAHKERFRICEEMSKKYSKYNIQVAGETGIDITLAGMGKEQIIHDFSPHDSLVFYGDKIVPGGNDYDLAVEIIQSGGNVWPVRSWEETWELLREL